MREIKTQIVQTVISWLEVILNVSICNKSQMAYSKAIHSPNVFYFYFSCLTGHVHL